MSKCNHLPTPNLTFQVQILQHMNVSVSCLVLPSVLRDQVQLTLGHPHPHSVPYLINKCRKEKNTSKLCQQLPYVKYRTDGFWKECKRNDPWFNTMLTKLPINEAINESSLGGSLSLPQVLSSCVILELIHLPKDGHINVLTAGK